MDNIFVQRMRKIPSEGRNQVSERNDKVFFRDHSFGDSDSFDI